MAEVPEHLVPTDGLCNYSVRMESMVTDRNGGAIFNFSINEQDRHVASIPVHVRAESDGLYGMYTRAHRELTNIFRQLVHISDVLRNHYETEGVRRSQPGTPA